MLETEVRTLILFRGNIVNRVLQRFVLVDFTNVQHCINIKVTYSSCCGEGIIAGEIYDIKGAPL